MREATDSPGPAMDAHRVVGAAALAAALIMAASGAAHAAPDNFTIDPAHTHVHWELRHFGTSTVRGRFDAIVGGVTLDRGNHTGSASFTIQTGSVTTGFTPFDGVVRGPDVLASAANPVAYFVSNHFVFDGERLAAVAGELTLHGASQGLTLTTKRFACRPAGDPPREVCGGDFEGEIDRSAFGIPYATPFVSNRVRIIVEIEAQRVDAAPP